MNFDLKTTISQFYTFTEFAGAFELNANDLIITRASVYNPYIRPLSLPCHVLLQSDYGNGEPSDEMINNIIHDLKGVNYNRVIAIGGGTVIDIAKILIIKNIDIATDAFERKIPIEKAKQLVVLPTTCGTGSEVTNISIAEIRSRHTKMGLADDALLPDYAVLIPELMSNLPFKFFVFSAIDALIHAVESYVSPKANPFTQLFSKEAIHIILDVFQGISQNGPEYRQQRLKDMLLAANYAGIAFGKAGVGAVHALSYPLGANYHVPHGESNYQFFIEVFKLYNEKQPIGVIQDVNRLFVKELNLPEGCDYSTVYNALSALLGHLISRKPLRKYGMKSEEINLFAHSVITTQQRLLGNNYVPLTEEDIKGVYGRLW